MIFNGRSGVVR